MISVATRVTALTMSIMFPRRFPPAQNRYLAYARRNLQSSAFISSPLQALRLAITHLACHDRKTAPALRARRYRRVQRQKIVWKVIPSITLTRIAIFRTGQFRAWCLPLRRPLAAMTRGRHGGALRQLRSLTGVIGVSLHGNRCQLFHAGRRLFQAAGLLFSTGRRGRRLPAAISLVPE